MELFKESPRYLALKIECKEQLGQKLFVVLEKNKGGSYILFYRKKIHKEASTIADHLPAYFLKLYGEGVLSLFDPYYQDLAKDTKWIKNQLYYDNKIELHKKKIT